MMKYECSDVCPTCKRHLLLITDKLMGCFYCNTAIFTNKYKYPCVEDLGFTFYYTCGICGEKTKDSKNLAQNIMNHLRSNHSKEIYHKNITIK